MKGHVKIHRLVWLGALALASIARTAHAQDTMQWSRAAADTVLSWRMVANEGTAPVATFFADSICTVKVVNGVTVLSRPIAWRTNDVWNGRVAQLTVQYETGGNVGVRLEGGYLAPVAGLASLEMRADVNPTVMPALSFDQALPTFDPGTPRLALYALTYPLGAQLSVSGNRWDARAALVDSSPMRARMPFAADQPKAAPQIVVGGGMSPRPGLRVGGWWATGAYARAEELRNATTDRHATIGALETEFAIAHSRIASELIAARLDTANGRATATTWMLEGSQALTPRWFVAGRSRLMHAPPRATVVPVHGAPAHVTQSGGELTVGYRVNPELTVRAGAVARQPFGIERWTQGAAFSLVWARRWF